MNRVFAIMIERRVMRIVVSLVGRKKQMYKGEKEKGDKFDSYSLQKTTIFISKYHMNDTNYHLN